MNVRAGSMFSELSGWQNRQAGNARCEFWTVVSALLLVAALGLTPCQAADVPVVKGDLGPCSANFTVTDSADKPLYDAKIHVTVLYGFMNKRKSDFEVGTNSDGKARIEGLPEKVKKLLEFKIRHGGHNKSVMHDPANECQANFTVVLDTP
jgi:hypothetical protein